MYLINGSNIQDPTTCKPVPLVSYGLTGEGKGIYASVFEFELTWNVISIADFRVLTTWWQYSLATGTQIVATLPLYGPTATSWALYAYTGVTLMQPEPGEYFEEYILNAKMVIGNVRLP